ncbi:MAG: hypothetical protein ACQKBV_00455, partial [Puniceicoccales bacterium]
MLTALSDAHRPKGLNVIAMKRVLSDNMVDSGSFSINAQRVDRPGRVSLHKRDRSLPGLIDVNSSCMEPDSSSLGDQSVKLSPGSEEHRAALDVLERVKNDSGVCSQAYADAARNLDLIQKKIDWSLSSGVKSGDGGQRKLSVQFLQNRFVRVERNTGQELTWDELKKELVSREKQRKEDARFFQLIKFRANGYEKFSFKKDKERERYLNHGISRCQENVEWVDGLTLDFDSGVTDVEFRETYSQDAFVLTSSFNH